MHTVRSETGTEALPAQRMEELLPGCASVWMFPTCVLSCLLLLSLRNVSNTAWKAPGMLPWNVETHSSPLAERTCSLASCSTCFPCTAHPKNNWHYSGTALNLQEKVDFVPSHWQSLQHVTGFLVLSFWEGAYQLNYPSRCLQ